MPPLPVLSGAACIRLLCKLGYVVVHQKGSHARLMCGGRPPVTVPIHDELDRGTLRAIIRQTGLTVDQFVAMLGR